MPATQNKLLLTEKRLSSGRKLTDIAREARTDRFKLLSA